MLAGRLWLTASQGYVGGLQSPRKLTVQKSDEFSVQQEDVDQTSKAITEISVLLNFVTFACAKMR